MVADTMFKIIAEHFFHVNQIYFLIFYAWPYLSQNVTLSFRG